MRTEFQLTSNAPFVEYFKYSTFGNVTAYISDIGQGRTLASVIQLVKTKPKILYSNAHLFGLDYTYQPFDEQVVLDDLKNATIFTDMTDMIFDSRLNQHHAVSHSLLTHASKYKLKFILNATKMKHLDINIRQTITDVVFCEFIPKQRLHLIHCKMAAKSVWQVNPETGIRERTMQMYLKPISQCLLRHVDKYFKYYNTSEIIFPLPKRLVR